MLKKLNYILLIGFLILQLSILIKQPLYAYGLIFFVFYFLFRHFTRHLKINEIWYTLAIISANANTLGNLYFYYHITWYDKILHFIVPLWIAMFVYYLLKLCDITTLRWFLTIFIVMGAGAIFEVGEYYVDRAMDTTLIGVFDDNNVVIVGGLEDTMMDLTLDFIGSLCGVGLIGLKKSLHI